MSISIWARIKSSDSSVNSGGGDSSISLYKLPINLYMVENSSLSADSEYEQETVVITQIIFIASEVIIQVGCVPKLGHVLFDPLSYETEKFQQEKALINELKPSAHTPENESTKPQPSSVLETKTEMEEESTPLTKSRRCLLANKTDNVVSIADILKMNENSDRDTTKYPKLIRPLRYGDFGDRNNKESCAEYDYNKNDCKVINNRVLCGYNKNKGRFVDDEVIDMGNDCRLRNGRVECGYLEPPYKNPRRPPANDDEGKPVQLRARDSSTLKIANADNCTDCSSKNPNEAILSGTGALLRAPKHHSKLSLKASALGQGTTDSQPEQGIPQESNDSSGEFMTPIPEAVESHSKLEKTIETSPKIVPPIPLSIPLSIPVAIDYLPIQVRYGTLPKSEVVSPQIEISKVKIETPSLVDKTDTETDLLSRLGKLKSVVNTSVTKEDIMNTENTPEVLSKLVETTQKTAEPLLEITDRTEVEVSTNTQNLGTAPTDLSAHNKTSVRKFLRALRSAGSTPDIIQQPTVTSRTRWCVEKGDRIVCYYSQNY